MLRPLWPFMVFVVNRVWCFAKRFACVVFCPANLDHDNQPKEPHLPRHMTNFGWWGEVRTNLKNFGLSGCVSRFHGTAKLSKTFVRGSDFGCLH